MLRLSVYSRGVAPARRKGVALRVLGGTPSPVAMLLLLPKKARALQQPLHLPPQSRQRRLGGVSPR
jgi:hypothetical protein